MDTTNQLTVMGRLYSHFTSHQSSPAIRLGLIVILALLVHLVVKAIRQIGRAHV